MKRKESFDEYVCKVIRALIDKHGFDSRSADEMANEWIILIKREYDSCGFPSAGDTANAILQATGLPF